MDTNIYFIRRKRLKLRRLDTLFSDVTNACSLLSVMQEEYRYLHENNASATKTDKMTSDGPLIPTLPTDKNNKTNIYNRLTILQTNVILLFIVCR